MQAETRSAKHQNLACQNRSAVRDFVPQTLTGTPGDCRPQTPLWSLKVA